MTNTLTRPVLIQVTDKNKVIYEEIVDVYKTWSFDKEKIKKGKGVHLTDSAILHVAKSDFRDSPKYLELEKTSDKLKIDACLAD